MNGTFPDDSTVTIENIPQKPDISIVDQLPLNAELKMTWNNRALAHATEIEIKKFKQDIRVLAPSTANPENNYICNNVSFVALAATKFSFLTLAKDGLTIGPYGGSPTLIRPDTQVGFFHLPRGIENRDDHIHTWVHILATAIKTALDK